MSGTKAQKIDIVLVNQINLKSYEIFMEKKLALALSQLIQPNRQQEALERLHKEGLINFK